MLKNIFCLGIESSCDDSSISIVDNNYKVHYLLTESHLKCLEPFQGVMPETVSREHVRSLPTLVKSLNESFPLNNIDFIAYTAGPGLAGSLLVGASLAQSLSIILNKPLMPIHHIEGHQLAYLLENSSLSFPCLSLVISGGHTQLMLLETALSYKIIGQTRDDAAGEAFDKIAKYIGLGYPGGPALAAMAQKGNSNAHQFSIPLASPETLDFSFSGLKTQAVRIWDQQILSREDFCASIEETIVKTLMLKTKQALKKYPKIKSILLSGGVACNVTLRKEAMFLVNKHSLELHIPQPKYCADNAAMIAAAGMHRWHQNQLYSFSTLKPLIRPSWSIEDIQQSS